MAPPVSLGMASSSPIPAALVVIRTTGSSPTGSTGATAVSGCDVLPTPDEALDSFQAAAAARVPWLGGFGSCNALSACFTPLVSIPGVVILLSGDVALSGPAPATAARRSSPTTAAGVRGCTVPSVMTVGVRWLAMRSCAITEPVLDAARCSCST
eukprot:scaffold239559_cov30-Tisochrysis_lutea.AAC.2